DMVIYLVLLVLFLQIIFAGAIFDLPEAARPVSYTTITYWALDALGSTVDMNRLDDLGETKIDYTSENPITGDEETVEVRENVTSESDVEYSHSPSHLLGRWAILAGFSLVLGIATCVVMKRKDQKSGAGPSLGGIIMKNKGLIIAVVVLAVVAGGVYVIWNGLGLGATAAPAATPALLTAEAQVVPVQWAALAFKSGGPVVSVAVQEGDAVTAGQELARLDDAELRYAVEKAKANLASAEADLAQLKEGAQPGDVAAAQADLDAAQAELTRVRRGATAEEIAVADAKVKQAEVEVSKAESNYERVKAWGGQAATEAAHALNAAHAALSVAQAELARVKAPPTTEAIAAAQAQVDRAQAAVTKLEAGATTGEVAVAQAHVNAAQVSLNQAEAALSDVILKAPFDGTVARLELRAGEMASPGMAVIWLGDLTAWLVETTDLTELEVADIREGDPVLVTSEAIPGLRLPGQVTHVQSFGKKKKDEILYTVVVTPETAAYYDRLRWNMTALVTFTGR
ncbi:MAG: efflux RND transporter periplasmic adaptor subunit, partial [Chloroflexi bacterium]|nr:efflux RND transporter periplasmic adaptor subunit [Chloroflexota bacterium]